MKFPRRISLCVFGVFLAVVAAAWWTATPGDPALYPPAANDQPVEIIAADHGIHVALIVPRDLLMQVASTRGLPALIAVGARFADYENLEIGWGDETFYHLHPAFDRVTIESSFRALLGLNTTTVMYIAGGNGDPADLYRFSNPARLRLSRAGFANLAAELDKSFDVATGQPTVIGPGEFGASLFYRALGHYSLFNVCNHWTARLLAAAGLPTTPVIDTISLFLMLDLQWRAGAKPVGQGGQAPSLY